MEQAGVPRFQGRLVVHPGAPFFLWDAQRETVILLPSNWKDMPQILDPQIGDKRHFPGFHFQALILLHEWGHSLLHPPADPGWVKLLTGPAREHAHPAFSHVGEYAGWRVFNEMFADAFSCAWVLRLFDRHPAVVQALLGLRRQRQLAARQRNTVHFPCYHNTADIILRVLSQQWDGPVDDIQARLLHECCQSFSRWYESGPVPGHEICSSSLSHLRLLDREFKHSRQSLYVYGRAWRSISQPKNHATDRLLDLLFQDQPDHFLLSLSAVSDVYQPPAQVVE